MAYGSVNVPGKLTAEDVGALPISGGTLTGDLRIKGSGNYGTKINLGDGDYVHISEPTDDCMEIKAKKMDIVLSDTSTSKITINGIPLLSAIGAAAANHSHSGYASSSHTHSAADVKALPISGGTMSGPLAVLEPTEPQHAATKEYVDSVGNLLAQIIFQPQNTGTQPKVYNVTLEPYNQRINLYKFEFSTTLGSSGWASVRLAPPAGYAFTMVSTAGPYPVVMYNSSGSSFPTNKSNGSFEYTLPANTTIQNIKFVLNTDTSCEYALAYVEVA